MENKTLSLINKALIVLAVAMMMTTAMPGHATPSKTTGPSGANTAPARAARFIERLEELNALDKATMSPMEKRTARKEVRTINQELKQQDGGIYLSVGAAVIIVLLLIILL